MKKVLVLSFMVLGLVLFAGCTAHYYVCPGGETVADPDDCVVEEPEPQAEEVLEEQVEPEEPQIEEVEEEEFEDEVVCVPAAGEGSYVKFGLYDDYDYVEGGGRAYGDIYMGQYVESGYGQRITLEGFRIEGGECESCDSEPEGVELVRGHFVISGLFRDTDFEYYVDDGDTVHFCISGSCTEKDEKGVCLDGICREYMNLHIFDVHAEMVCGKAQG